MRVWELEEGKEYEVNNVEYLLNFRYKICNGVLNFCRIEEPHLVYMESDIPYNMISHGDFTEYTPPIDWSKVEVDTKLLVKGDRSDRWIRRYFAKYENNRIYAFDNGYTSWVSGDSDTITCWDNVKLYTEES